MYFLWYINWSSMRKILHIFAMSIPIISSKSVKLTFAILWSASPKELSLKKWLISFKKSVTFWRMRSNISSLEHCTSSLYCLFFVWGQNPVPIYNNLFLNAVSSMLWASWNIVTLESRVYSAWFTMLIRSQMSKFKINGKNFVCLS